MIEEKIEDLKVFTSDPKEMASMSRLEVLRELHNVSEVKRSTPSFSMERLKWSFRLSRLTLRALTLGVEGFAIHHAIGAVSSNPLAIKRGA